MKKTKKIILVTGGNRGIGLAIVKALAKDKNNMIFLGCRNLLQGKSVAQKINGNVTAVLLNLSTKKILKKHIQNIIKKYKRIDVLINNAGVLINKSFLKINNKTFEESLQSEHTCPPSVDSSCYFTNDKK